MLMCSFLIEGHGLCQEYHIEVILFEQTPIIHNIRNNNSSFSSPCSEAFSLPWSLGHSNKHSNKHLTRLTERSANPERIAAV